MKKRTIHLCCYICLFFFITPYRSDADDCHYKVAVAVLEGGIIWVNDPNASDKVALAEIAERCRRYDARVTAKVFRSALRLRSRDQILRVQYWLKKLNNQCDDPVYAILIGHSLGGNAAILVSSPNICSRFLLDHWDPKYLNIRNQRELEPRTVNVEGNVFSYLAQEPSLSILGRRIAGNTVTEVESAYDDIMSSVKQKNPEANIQGVSVQNMAKQGVEIIIGMSQDPQFGPVIMFGLGGVMVEILKDVSFRLIPLTEKDASDMIKEIKGYPMLEGYRGQAPCDISSLKQLLLKVSDFVVANPDIEEIDLNPVFAYSEGAIAVDARIVLGDKES